MDEQIPPDLLEQAAEVLAALKQIDPTLKIGSMSQAEFADEMAKLQELQAEIARLEQEVADHRNRQEELRQAISDIVKLN